FEINSRAGNATVADGMVVADRMVMVGGHAAGAGQRIRSSADMAHVSDRRAGTQPLSASRG
ncbi:hypothetical protein, partial [Candidatus Protofrankia californiensis]|uniref:hypothetical protein n=1 Tax=Candidatus Protofrankia californiensis TaxID=1839754 RepID=UPI0019D05F0D